MVTVYFEDPKIHPRLMNSAVRHSLWRFTKRHDAAFRVYTAAHRGQLTSGQLACSGDEAGSKSPDDSVSYSDSDAGAIASAVACLEGPGSNTYTGVAQRQVKSLSGVPCAAEQPSYADMKTMLQRQRSSSSSDGRTRLAGLRRLALCTAVAICARRLA